MIVGADGQRILATKQSEPFLKVLNYEKMQTKMPRVWQKWDKNEKNESILLSSI
jgi:hypothetical protein